MSEDNYGILLSFDSLEKSEKYFSRSSFPKDATMVQRAGNLEKCIKENIQLKQQLQEEKDHTRICHEKIMRRSSLTVEEVAIIRRQLQERDDTQATLRQQLQVAVELSEGLLCDIHLLYQEITHYEDCDSLIENPDQENEFQCDCGIDLRFNKMINTHKQTLEQIKTMGNK